MAATQAFVSITQHKWLDPKLLWDGPGRQRAAELVMDYERTRPGTFQRFLAGDEAARAAIYSLIAEAAGTWSDTYERRRVSTVSDPALSSSSEDARTMVGLKSMQAWVAHHLIPFGVMARLPVDVQLAIVASGWVLDSPENLIALPANLATFVAPPNRGFLPYQNGSHYNYDADVATALASLVIGYTALPKADIRTRLLIVEQTQRALLAGGRYHVRVN